MAITYEFPERQGNDANRRATSGGAVLESQAFVQAKFTSFTLLRKEKVQSGPNWQKNQGRRQEGVKEDMLKDHCRMEVDWRRKKVDGDSVVVTLCCGGRGCGEIFRDDDVLMETSANASRFDLVGKVKGYLVWDDGCAIKGSKNYRVQMVAVSVRRIILNLHRYR